MDGLLVVDKPAGPTSHEVVARVRRALGERRVGHTGTLDPAATGVLPLVLGRATRLARFLSASDKSYEAVVHLGVATDTHDAEGVPVGAPYQGPLPSRDAIDRALDAFRGTFLQQPPAYSAKKIGGRRSYELARAASRDSQLSCNGAGAPPPAPTDADASPETARHATPAREPRREPRHGGRRSLADPVSVTTHTIELVSVDGDKVTLRVECSAGFYVRALADDLGERLGVGAHLFTLRRIRSGDFALDQALALDAIEREPDRGIAAVIPLSRMLPRLPSVTLTSQGVRHAAHGRNIGPEDARGEVKFLQGFVRLLDPSGDLVAIAAQAGASGLLHPAIVLM
jgi:tRNA pseudouridine55 synthase